jgi:hypothetical protein
MRQDLLVVEGVAPATHDREELGSAESCSRVV